MWRPEEQQHRAIAGESIGRERIVVPESVGVYLSRGRARSNHVPCASGGRVPPTTDAVHASNAPALCSTHDARGLPACCGVRVSPLPRGVHVLRERLGADMRRGLLPEGAALGRRVEPLQE